MPYPFPRYERNGPHTKAAVKFSQDIFSAMVKIPSPDTFGGRLLIAAKTAKKGEVARLLGVKPSMVSAYMKAEAPEGSYPDVERLVGFSERVNCDLHYLLTGKRLEREAGEPKDAGESYNLKPWQTLFVQKLADARGVSFEKIIGELACAGLDAKARELSRAYPNMGTTQLEDVLDAVLPNMPNEENSEEESSRKAARQ